MRQHEMEDGTMLQFRSVEVSTHALNRYRQRVDSKLEKQKASIRILRDIFTTPKWSPLPHDAIGVKCGSRTYVMREDASRAGCWIVVTMWDNHTKRKVIKRDRRKRSK